MSIFYGFVERGLFVGFRKLDQGGNWIARFRNEDGKQVYMALGPVTTTNDYETAKREARRWSMSVEAGVKSSDVETVGEACIDYVEGLKSESREDAAQDALQRFQRCVLNDPLGKIKLSQIRERHLEAWRQRMMAGEFEPVPVKGARKVKPLTPSVFKRTLTTLKAALNRAVRKRYVSAERALEWQEIKPEKGHWWGEGTVRYDTAKTTLKRHRVPGEVALALLGGLIDHVGRYQVANAWLAARLTPTEIVAQARMTADIAADLADRIRYMEPNNPGTGDPAGVFHFQFPYPRPYTQETRHEGGLSV